MLAAIAIGLASAGLSTALFLPQSRALIEKLRALVQATQQQDAVLHGEKVEAITPFVDGKFMHKRITGILRADLSGFGDGCVRLQREAKALDRNAHLAMLPVILCFAGLLLWFVLR